MKLKPKSTSATVLEKMLVQLLRLNVPQNHAKIVSAVVLGSISQLKRHLLGVLDSY